MSALSDDIVGRLTRIGTRAIFGVPGGGGNLELIQAAQRAGLPFVLTATETGGALAAMAQAEVTGQPGACLTTLGPGAASVTNGVACAFLDRAPMLVFTDSQPSSADAAFEHQRLDQQALFRPITRWSGRLTPDCAQRTLDRAFAEVLEVPPGPVHIDCPGDESRTPPPADDIARPDKKMTSAAAPSPSGIDSRVAALSPAHGDRSSSSDSVRAGQRTPPPSGAFWSAAVCRRW